jgi:FkbM family methyltransferase
MKLQEEIIKALQSNINNRFNDNYDFHRFGPPSPDVKDVNHANYSLKKLTRRRIKRLLRWFRSLFHDRYDPAYLIRSSNLFPFMDRLNTFYGQLNDEESRSLMVIILAFRILGNTSVKLPLNSPEYWSGIKRIEALSDERDLIKTDFYHWTLNRMNLGALGLPIDLYITPWVAYTEYILRQYEYSRNGISFSVEEGDTVIDAGACWGDTALLFAHQAGAYGRVFSFEFLPTNIAIFNRNLSLNPHLSKRITLFPHPLWEDSGRVVYYTDHGPGSVVSFDNIKGAAGNATTLSIDDVVEKNILGRVDFIKMDIEGAELKALAGARNTICKYRPKLAIALYHSLEDFVGVPEFIQSLGLGYSFYLGHFTIHEEETVLYAVPEKNNG